MVWETILFLVHNRHCVDCQLIPTVQWGLASVSKYQQINFPLKFTRALAITSANGNGAGGTYGASSEPHALTNEGFTAFSYGSLYYIALGL